MAKSGYFSVFSGFQWFSVVFQLCHTLPLIDMENSDFVNVCLKVTVRSLFSLAGLSDHTVTNGQF